MGSLVIVLSAKIRKKIEQTKCCPISFFIFSLETTNFKFDNHGPRPDRPGYATVAMSSYWVILKIQMPRCRVAAAFENAL